MPSQFAQLLVPLLWDQQFAMYGRTVLYHQESMDPEVALSLDVIWKEGRGEEEVSPGRYSHILNQNADLPGGPMEGDLVEADGVLFDVVSIDADSVGYSRAILQEQGDAI